MIEYIEKAKLGEEELVKLLDEKIENIEIDKQKEIDKAVAEDTVEDNAESVINEETGYVNEQSNF